MFRAPVITSAAREPVFDVRDDGGTAFARAPVGMLPLSQEKKKQKHLSRPCLASTNHN
jgi:hypothetical protein